MLGFKDYDFFVKHTSLFKKVVLFAHGNWAIESIRTYIILRKIRFLGHLEKKVTVLKEAFLPYFLRKKSKK